MRTFETFLRWIFGLDISDHDGSVIECQAHLRQVS